MFIQGPVKREWEQTSYGTSGKKQKFKIQKVKEQKIKEQKARTTLHTHPRVNRKNRKLYKVG